MKVLQKIAAVFLALVFLLSSLGFTVNKMTCLKSGKVRVSFVAQKDCCEMEKSALPIIKSKCCDLANSYFNLGDVQHSQKLLLEKQVSATVPFFYTQKYVSALSKISLISYADLPPPKSGRTLLNFISTLTI